MREPRNLWNIMNKTQISLKRIAEKIKHTTHTHTHTHIYTHTHTHTRTHTQKQTLPPPFHIALKGVFTLCFNHKIT